MLQLKLKEKKKSKIFRDKETEKKYRKADFKLKVIGKSQDTNQTNKIRYTMTFQFDDYAVDPYIKIDQESGDRIVSYPIFNRIVSQNKFYGLNHGEVITASLYTPFKGKNWYFSYASLKRKRDFKRGLELKL